MGKKSREKKERKQEKLVVFVCTANVCRSPMAEKLFEDALTKSKITKKVRVFFSRYLCNGWGPSI